MEERTVEERYWAYVSLSGDAAVIERMDILNIMYIHLGVHNCIQIWRNVLVPRRAPYPKIKILELCWKVYKGELPGKFDCPAKSNIFAINARFCLIIYLFGA